MVEAEGSVSPDTDNNENGEYDFHVEDPFGAVAFGVPELNEGGGPIGCGFTLDVEGAFHGGLVFEPGEETYNGAYDEVHTGAVDNDFKGILDNGEGVFPGEEYGGDEYNGGQDVDHGVGLEMFDYGLKVHGKSPPLVA